jgi:hypothetical protein
MPKVMQLRGNSQFQHNTASNLYLGMKILQNEITATQTSFPTNFGSKLSFNPVFSFFHTITAVITLQPCPLNFEFQHFILRFNKNLLTLQIILN